MTTETKPTEQARGGAELLAALEAANKPTETTSSTSTFDAEIAEILGGVTAPEPAVQSDSGDWYVQDSNSGPTALELAQAATDANDANTRKVGEIKILRTDRKGMKHLVKQTYFAPDHSEAKEIAQRLKDDGVLDSRFSPDYSFHQHMYEKLHPSDLAQEPMRFGEFDRKLKALEQTTGVARNLPVMANAGFDVGQALIDLCDGDDEKAELLAAVASQLPAYLRGKMLRDHIGIVEDAQDGALERHLDKLLAPAFKRMQFEAGAMGAGADRELLPELVQMARTGKRMRLNSMLSEAPWLLPFVPFGDAPDLSAAMLELSEFVPAAGLRWSTTALYPVQRGVPAPTYPDGKAPPAGTSRIELSLRIARTADAVTFTVRERHLDADAWGMLGTNNPFVVQAAWSVRDGEVQELDVSKERAANLEFLRGLAYEFGATLNFADGFNTLRRMAESAK